jgi:hypothetical protein
MLLYCPSETRDSRDLKVYVSTLVLYISAEVIMRYIRVTNSVDEKAGSTKGLV